MTIDSAAVRREFPAFAAQSRPLHYLDNAATGQILGCALDATVEFEVHSRANVNRGNHRLAEAATAAFDLARSRVARFLNADAEEVVFTGGATAAINLVAGAMRSRLRPGDEILVSYAEHHSNFLPWQRLRDEAGIVLRLLPLTADGRIDMRALGECVRERCRLIAVTHASNVTGAVTDLPPLLAAARAVGARVLLDGAQMVQHGPVDVRAAGADFYAFSGHKAFAPTGVGVLWGKREVLAELPPFQTGGGTVAEVGVDSTRYAEAPRRFEAGTPPIAQAVGLGRALEWLGRQDWPAIHTHEATLTRQLLDALAGMPGLRLLGPTELEARLPIVSFAVAGLHPHDVCQILDRHGVALRGGHHCAQPLLRCFGFDGLTRASIALYNSEADIAALQLGLDDARRILA